MDGGPDPRGKGHFSGEHMPAGPAHCNVLPPRERTLHCLPAAAVKICLPIAHAVDECIRRREGCDKMTMRPFAKLLWTPVVRGNTTTYSYCRYCHVTS